MERGALCFLAPRQALFAAATGDFMFLDPVRLSILYICLNAVTVAHYNSIYPTNGKAQGVYGVPLVYRRSRWNE